MTVATTDNRTSLHQLIDAKLGGDGVLAALVDAARHEDQSWAVITRTVHDMTGHTSLTESTLRNWFTE